MQAAAFLWDSLFGLIFGFLISAVVQVMLTPATMHRYLGPGLKGLLFGTGFGIISSACSYGAAAAARGFYRSGADVRSIFAFLISSTNMNVAIVILFWSLLGWRFAFAEFFGGIIIIAVVTVGFTLLFRAGELERLQREQMETQSAPESTCHEHAGAEVRRDWSTVAATALADVRMLRTELIVGYLIAGFAAALVPPGWLSGALHAVGAVPYVGYLLLLFVGLLIAVATFVCSMGNVPIARFLADAGIPLGANTTFIYGDLLILPLIAIYRKSFPPRVTWTFVGLFTFGAMLAGAIMERLIGSTFGGALDGLDGAQRPLHADLEPRCDRRRRRGCNRRAAAQADRETLATPARAKRRVVVIVPIHRFVVEKFEVLERVRIVTPAQLEVPAPLELLPHLANERPAIVRHQNGVEKAVTGVRSDLFERARNQKLGVSLFVERMKRQQDLLAVALVQHSARKFVFDEKTSRPKLGRLELRIGLHRAVELRRAPQMFELVTSEPNLAITYSDRRGDNDCGDGSCDCGYRLPDHDIR